MTALAKMVRESKRRSLYEGPIWAAVYGCVAVGCVTFDYPWVACLFAFLAGALGGASIISVAWLRTHYREEWDAA